jgi:Icc-related predicted phosphoesterase
MTRDPRSLLAIGNPGGDTDRLSSVLEMRDDLGFDAIAVVGDLTADGETGSDDYRRTFELLGDTGVPAFWVPGSADAPVHV